MRNALGWTMAAHMAQMVNGEQRKACAPHVIPLADRRRALLIAEKGDASLEEAADADAEDRARLRGAWKAMVRR